jgi:ribosomal protein S18 acetylase RimI-like enzyme
MRAAKDKDGAAITRRIATAADLPMIAAIHKAAYSRSHFTSLLPLSTLERYYAAFLDEGTQISLALDGDAAPDEAALGFSVYGTGIPEKIAAFKKACARDILLTSLRHPWTAGWKAFDAVKGRIGRHVAVPPADFLLLSIAVARPTGGIGSVMLRDLIAAARERGHATLGLYVNDDNIRAINAYYRAGFRMRDFHNGQYYMEAAAG